MFKFIIETIFQQNKMSNSSLNLHQNNEDKQCADEFAMYVERLAEQYEVTCDYILDEFILD